MALFKNKEAQWNVIEVKYKWAIKQMTIRYKACNIPFCQLHTRLYGGVPRQPLWLISLQSPNSGSDYFGTTKGVTWVRVTWGILQSQGATWEFLSPICTSTTWLAPRRWHSFGGDITPHKPKGKKHGGHKTRNLCYHGLHLTWEIHPLELDTPNLSLESGGAASHHRIIGSLEGGGGNQQSPYKVPGGWTPLVNTQFQKTHLVCIYREAPS